MRNYESVTIPAKHETRLASVTCDKCGKDVKEGFDHCYKRADIEIHYWVGECYPESDCTEGWSIDCCAECFEEVVIPALKNAGFKIPDKMEYDDWMHNIMTGKP